MFSSPTLTFNNRSQLTEYVEVNSTRGKPKNQQRPVNNLGANNAEAFADILLNNGFAVLKKK